MRDTDTPDDTPWLIGIAASAGGLEAITGFLHSLPAESGAAYVIAQHMSPTHKSLMSVLMSRETALPVTELSGVNKPEPNHIYVTPPNWDVVFEDGMLRLLDPAGRTGAPKPSADRLFYSLAEQCGGHCMAIVLSGTGSDGAYGVKAVREAGGITLAQDQSSAKYDGMPVAAIESGCVDLILTPEQMGQHLERILSSPRDLSAIQQLDDVEDRHKEILQVLLARTCVDFREYKANTVERRINRRMTALGITDYESYVDRCRNSSAEVDNLFADLLISVTRFFRDPAQFDRLASEISNLVANLDEGTPLRIWVAGCATGEEAYSVAILVAEAFGGPEDLDPRRIQIFATDIDETALRTARRGEYPAAAANDIPVQLIEKYFDRNGNKLSVRKSIKQLILFSHHNVFQDPPFIHLDLVTMRNLMIYFTTSLQERVLSRVLYALNSRGLLFLGTSEGVGPMQSDFDVVSDRNRLFRKRIMTHRSGRPGFEDFRFQTPRWLGASRRATRREPQSGELHRQMFEALARSVGTDAVLVTPNQSIIRIFGDISPYVELDEETHLDLSLSLLKPPLRDEAPSLCSIAAKHGERRRGVRHKLAIGQTDYATLEAFPIRLEGEKTAYTLLAIHTDVAEVEDTSRPLDQGDLRQLRQLEADFQSTREALRQTVEELQTSNEELQSLNEELQSANEDLQATNEELETSNEELQSSNEELLTVNEELQVNSAELDSMRQDIESVLRSVPMSVIVVDHAMQITRHSDNARALFQIDDGLERMHLSQCRVPDGFPPLAQLASAAFRERGPQSVELEIGATRVSLKALPYFDDDRNLRGVTIVVTEDDTSELVTKMRLFEDLTGFGDWTLDLDTNELTWSDAVFSLHGRPRNDGHPDPDTALGYFLDADRDAVQSALERAITELGTLESRARIRRHDGEVVLLESHGTTLFEDGQPRRIHGVTRRIRSAAAETAAGTGTGAETSGVFHFAISARTQRVHIDGTFFATLGLDTPSEDLTLTEFLTRVGTTEGEDIAAATTAALAERAPLTTGGRIRDLSGATRGIRLLAAPVRHDPDSADRLSGVILLDPAP
ncbi:MAG: chemotaxis protein CheB [Pseudooceanicola sp.]